MNQPVGMTHSDRELEAMRAAMRAIVEVLGHLDEAALRRSTRRHSLP